MFLSGPDFPRLLATLPSLKDRLNFVLSEATSAQVEEYFGSEIYPELLPCLCAGESFIMTKQVHMELDELTDNDWTTGPYQDIVNKYNANDVKEYPLAHAVDILSIATQSDPTPMKDVSDVFLITWREDIWENHRLQKLYERIKKNMKIDGKRRLRIRAG